MRFISAEALQPGMVIGRDIISTNRSHMLRKGVTLTDEYINYIQTKGYLGAYILDSLSSDILIQETISDELFEKGMEAAMENNIGTIVNVATDIVDEIVQSENLTVDLLDLRSYDDYTYHHSVNVALYAVVVGKKLGLSKEDLNLLCLAALTHDLGKSKIDLEILNKPGKLTDDEFEEIQSHPKYSFDILSEKNEVPALVKQAVLMHHENENGTGYPLGKSGEEIPIFAKIIHVVDVYDALTSKRAYKDPYPPVSAFEYLEGGTGILFDEKIVEVVTRTIPAYPPGITVILSDGREAIVVSHTDDALRPIIKMIETEKLVNLATDEAYKNVFIKASGIMQQDYVEEIEVLNEDRQGVYDYKPVIVVVDDMKMSLAQTKEAIKGDYDIVLLNSGIEFMNYLAVNDSPDLVIMDIDMPIMDGIKTVEKMYEQGYLGLPVMFLTSSKDRETVFRCKSVGAIDYICKPAKPVYLNERVEIALKNIVE